VQNPKVRLKAKHPKKRPIKLLTSYKTYFLYNPFMKKEILAKTLTPVYDELEDRIRLALNYQDPNDRVDFMITRNLILNLSPAADEFILKHYTYDTLIQDNITVNQQQSSDTSTSKTDAVNFDLYRTSEELLLEVNFAYDEKTKNTVLTLSSKSFIARAAFDEDTIKKVFELIKASIPYIKWGISYHF